MQMNSDSRPTQEYFDYLLGRNEQVTTEDGPSIIVGEGKIGTTHPLQPTVGMLAMPRSLPG